MCNSTVRCVFGRPGGRCPAEISGWQVCMCYNIEACVSHSDSANITCSEGFFFDDEDSNGRNATNTCKPACGEFLRKPLAQEFFENLGVCGSLVAGVLMFIIATTVQRKTL